MIKRRGDEKDDTPPVSIKSFGFSPKLRYPITIVKLLKAPGDVVKKQEPILRYSYKWMKEVGELIGGNKNSWQEEQVTIVNLDSPGEGQLQQWFVQEGDVINRVKDYFELQEYCGHEIQFNGLCGICGQDVTEKNYAADILDTSRAPINMVHDNNALTVSEAQAKHTESQLQRRLIDKRKLSLVVDLDQTIIHACIDPTVGEWQQDVNNPNHDAVKDVRVFQLKDDGPRGVSSSCSYYIKLRPGLEEFLRNISEMYELHVYTMGTRAYALNIAQLVDPDKKLFGNRVISRDENGSMTAKNLQRLFPVSTNMVVIIDDRADVWPRNRRNLIKVTPYDFFKGIGDINSSFLPKREDIIPAAPADDDKAKKSDAPNGKKADENGTGDSKVSALDEFVRMSGGENKDVTARQIEEQEKTLEQQIKDRPLQHLQEQLDKEDEEAEKKEATNGEDAISSQPRHHVLRDDDYELLYLERHLAALHRNYFEEYDKLHPSSPTRIAQDSEDEVISDEDEDGTRERAPKRPRRNNSAPTSKFIDIGEIPDVGEVLDSIKGQALRGTTIALSGILPVGVDIRLSEIGLQLASFGAKLRQSVTRDITHLVISSSRPRTKKVQQAAKYPHVKIVNQDWLTECMTKWQKVDETPYLIEVHPDDRPGAKEPASPADGTDDEVMEDAERDGTKSRSKVTRIDNLKLKIVTDKGDADGEDGDEDLEPRAATPLDISPIAWDDMDNELDDWLNDGDDDEDEDGENGDNEGRKEDGTDAEDDSELDADATPSTSKKRKHDESEDDGTDAESAAQGDSPNTTFAKKLRLARSRGSSSLRAQYNSDGDSSLPTPQVTGDEDEVSLLKTNGNDADDDDDLEAELEAELAEMEAEEKAAAG